MNKYVIELRPDCKVVQEICESDGKVSIGAKSINYLEELNSDYINEYFSDLQDTAYQKGYDAGIIASSFVDKSDEAYQRGFEDGKKEAESSEAIEQAKADAFNKGMLFKKEKIHDAFLRGVEKGKAVNDKGCEGCMYQDNTIEHHPCGVCCNAYHNQWTAKDDKIEVGDEVEWDNDFTGDRFIVTRIYQPYGKKEQCDGIDDDGDVYRAVLIESLVKTGRHFDIASILEEMRND